MADRRRAQPFDDQAAGRRGLRAVLRDLDSYSRLAVGRPLRRYQAEVGRALTRTVLRREGGTVTVMMSRQAGKNELSAHLEAYLLTLYGKVGGGSIVKCAPTFEPQLMTSKLRLQEVMRNRLEQLAPPEGMDGYVLGSGKARVYFLSAAPTARVVGATASLLLEADEAQGVEIEKHDRDLAPMCAATNATRAYYGVAATGDDLLARMKAHNLELERADGARRHFEYPWWAVAEENQAYGTFVEGERARLGAEHPAFLTQYELKATAPEDALFNEARLRQLQGDHERLEGPVDNRYYVAGVDLAGPDETAFDALAEHWKPRRVDSTVVTIAEVVWPGSDLAAGPVIRVVAHREWTGRSHWEQHVELARLLGEEWRCQSIEVDASGVGQAPCEMLARRLGERVKPFVFTTQSKSELGYGLLAAVGSGRVSVYRAGAWDRCATAFWGQAREARRRVSVAGLLGWEARRGHDDYVTSLALCVRAAEGGEAVRAGCDDSWAAAMVRG